MDCDLFPSHDWRREEAEKRYAKMLHEQRIKIEQLTAALTMIKEFGVRHPGYGMTCAKIAGDALGGFNLKAERSAIRNEKP